MQSFSERHGYQPVEGPIRYREDASPNLRAMVINFAEKHIKPSTIRTISCGFMMVAEDPGNWSEYPNVDGECRNLIESCDWFDVYNTIEGILGHLNETHEVVKAGEFQNDLNRLFRKDGAGWQMINGEVLARGSEPFNNITEHAQYILEQSNSRTAASEIHEAIRDISRRPAPDLTGAVHHAMAAVECLVRTVSSDPNSTLGEILKSKSKFSGIPAPLDKAVSKIWGYSSEKGRHVKEGAVPSFEEAELTVTVATAVCIYLSRKIKLHWQT